MEIILVIVAALIGAILGSFACCQAWRLRYRLQKRKNLGKRSVCMHCHKQLKWYDNIPIISWLSLHGRCRYCGKPIGRAEILAEVGGAGASIILALLYVAPLFYNNLSIIATLIQIGLIIIVNIILVSLLILAVYDGKWGEMPSRLLYLCAGLGIIFWGLNIAFSVVTGTFAWSSICSAVIGLIIMVGPCWLLYKISHEQFMGSGDWWLALTLALLLENWWLALWALTISCLLASLLSTPAAVKKKQHRLHFAPYLIAGSFAVLACQFLLLNMI